MCGFAQSSPIIRAGIVVSGYSCVATSEEVVDVVDSSQSGSDGLLYIGTSLDDARYSTGHLTFETFSGFVDGLLFSLRDFISAGEGESVLAEDTN